MAERHRKNSSVDLCQSFEATENGDVLSNGYVGLELQRPMGRSNNSLKSKSCFPNWKVIVSVLLFGATILLGLLIGYYVSKSRHGVKNCDCLKNKPPATLDKLDPRSLNSLHETAMYAISGERIATTLKNFTRPQVFSNTFVDKGLVQLIEGYFDKFGFLQKVSDFNNVYNITVSLPEKSQPNIITLATTDRDIIKMEPDVLAMQKEVPKKKLPANIEFSFPFMAYSPSGTAQGEIVYVHYGRHEDFQRVRKAGVPFKDRIALIRLGQGYIHDKIKQAQDNGVIGVLLYADPADDRDLIVPWCSPNAPFLSANDKSNGDPTTPGYPSSGGVKRMTVHEASLATIPSQPISCQMAEAIMRRASGKKAPKAWRGQMNATYYLGRQAAEEPGYFMSFFDYASLAGASGVIDMRVHNHFQKRTIRNVIGKIQGYQDPDHYIIIGATRTSYSTGDDSGIPGTGLLLELALNLYILVEQEQWLPKRTILLVSWGGAEYGNAGKAEFIEEYKDILSRRTVAYIDLDNPIQGNYTLEVVANSVLREVIYNAAQRVPSPDESQHMTFNTWLSRSEELSDDLQPKVTDPFEVMERGHGDPFYTQLGIPTIHVQYKPDRLNATILNLGITAYIEHFRQWTSTWEARHHFRHYTNIGRLMSLVTLSLADAAFLQFDIKRSSSWLQKQILNMEDMLKNVSKKAAEAIKQATTDLIKVSATMDHFIHNSAHYESVIQRRLINERLMQCEQLIIKTASHLYKLRHHLQGEAAMEAEEKEQSSQHPTYSLSTREVSLILHSIRSAKQTLKIQV